MIRPVALLLVLWAMAVSAAAQVRTGQAAFGDWRSDAPGVVRKITPADMPPPFATSAAGNPPGLAPKPAGAALKAPPGFTVRPFAKLEGPRMVRVAPNGDIFVAETSARRISVLRAPPGAGHPSVNHVFVRSLRGPFGIAFYPPGPNPRWIYVATVNSVLRYPYANGDLTPRGPAQTVIPRLANSVSGHTTRDLAVSPDGRRLFISVGSASNVGDNVPRKTREDTAAWQGGHALGAAWGEEENRANVLESDPDGKGLHVFAAGIRNCVGLAIHPVSHDVWCATNERDMLGDNLPPDYVTRVRQGAFYGWPWYYIGAHEDPRLKGLRPDLAGKVTVPDVLLQPHSAPLGMTFYDAESGTAAFPSEYRGDAFVALHGSWNRGARTGYKIVRIKLNGAAPAGTYQDFVTGFVVDADNVWGRPVAVAVARDGALLFTDDGGDVLWRVAYAPPK
jgi:glucose/arabinose dehydrogenase